MGSIAQKQIFSWKNIENIGDLERLKLVLDYTPDEKIISILEKERKNGRDKYPIEPMWNSILAGVIYQHISIESLRRELQRNGELRELCGFEGAAGIDAVPTSSAYSRFLRNLIRHNKEINAMFKDLVKRLTELLPDFGEMLAIDGKAISSLANGKKNSETKSKDCRSDVDANWGKKEYKGKNQDGTNYKKVVSWFGYKLHLVVDANYELPIAFKLTKASVAEQPVAHEILNDLNETHPEIIKRCKTLSGDKGYDTIKLNTELHDEYGIKPVIDIRNLWKDGEETRLLPGKENIVYNYKGDVFCVCLVSGVQRMMAYGGFEKDRGTLKYICPAKSYGITCAGCKKCPVRKSIRIDIDIDRRVFTPIARSSYTWKRMYKKRTSVERVNSRIDVSFGFENHYIRGQAKMQMRCGLALCIMLALAYGRIKENQKLLMRSLVKAAS
jgi:transposase